MAKLCLNCGRSNHDRSTTCKRCNASLGQAMRLDAPSFSRRFLLLISVFVVLLIVVILLNTLMPVRF